MPWIVLLMHSMHVLSFVLCWDLLVFVNNLQFNITFDRPLISMGIFSPENLFCKGFLWDSFPYNCFWYCLFVLLMYKSIWLCMLANNFLKFYCCVLFFYYSVLLDCYRLKFDTVKRFDIQIFPWYNWPTVV